MKYELGFIGAGNMAEAIARAAIESGIVSAGKMITADPVGQRREIFERLAIKSTDNNKVVISESKQVLLAIKPQMLSAVAHDLEAIDSHRQVIMSIMAGIATSKIATAAGKPLRVVRVMPNMPLMVGFGMAAIALGADAQAGDETLALQIFGAAGKAVVVDESQLDAVAAVSGSGPAYVFYLAEAMRQAADQLGLDEHSALLVEQTILGSARLLSKSDDTPSQLRQKVTSPGGTTEAAIKQFDTAVMSDVIIKAIKAARDRSLELGA